MPESIKQPDDDIRAYLTEMAELDAPPAWEQPLEQVRAGIRALHLEQDGPPRKVGKVENRVLAGPGGDLPVRIYWPEESDSDRALVVWYHGGGFVFGDLETADAACRRLCMEGDAIVMSVDYRLAPEHVFPAAAEDAVFAASWALQSATLLGASVNHVFVGGDSAGGNLAAVAAHGLRGSSPALAGQILIYPVTDFRDIEYESRVICATGYGLSQEGMDWFRELYCSSPADWADPRVSVLVENNLSGLPPAFVMTAGFDPLCSEGELYAQRLAEAGNDVEHLHLPGANHGVFNAVPGYRATQKVWVGMLKWLGRRAYAP